MKFTLLSFVSLTTTLVAVHAERAGTNASEQLTVKTNTGIYTGLIDSKFPKTRQFRSIAFAQPPVKSHRWLPPQKLSPSSEHHNSFDLPLSCPQFISSIPSLMSEYFADGARIYNANQSQTSGLVGAATSEDCLYLAIWTPASATPNSKLPVLFFMTGGGFSGGGVYLPYQLPMDWIERSQSHIVVTINYRVNIFGFPNARGLSDQNLGILDQRAALEWVRDNIASFGGDPTAITQWGQSAGSMSTDAHAHAFYDDPIARGYFLQSGTMFSGAAVTDKMFSNFTFVAQHFGCNATSGDNSAAELDCMRAVPFEQISNFIGQYGDSGATPALSFIPVADEHIVFSDYAARAQEGKIARVPVILSNTANEASSLVPYPANDPSAGFPQDIILAAEVSMFICPTYNSTLERNHASIPVYRYQHAGTYPNITPFKWVGAYHGNDIPMIFGTYDLVKGLGDVTQLEIDTSRAMQDHILAFAKDPYHGPQKIGWQPMNAIDPNGGKLIRFGADDKVLQYVDGLEVDAICQGTGNYDAFP